MLAEQDVQYALPVPQAAAVKYKDFVALLAHQQKSKAASNLYAAFGILRHAEGLMKELDKGWVDTNPAAREIVINELGEINFFLQVLQNNLSISDAEIVSTHVMGLAVSYEAARATKERAEQLAQQKNKQLPGWEQEHLSNNPAACKECE